MSVASTIRSEGGLLPRDVLARIAAQDGNLGGLTADDFHLAPGERLGEAIARSWARLTAAWALFATERDLLPAADPAGRLTRERWLLPLFSELGYGRLVQHPAVELDGRSFAVFCEYAYSPLHLVGAGVALDRRSAGVRGAAGQSPHSLVQELLNRSDERLWGIVTNGLSLRLLRDNVTLTRQAYVEFDLEAILAGEAYEDFALLWLCCHQSRLEAERAEDCWLERWTQIAQRDGTRALETLRGGVERAIETLGRGFLAHRANTDLQAALRDGQLDGPAYYRQLLRTVYRLLFCFVAEDRDVLLLNEDGSPQRRENRGRFADYYSTARLRRLAGRRRGGQAHDLYEQLKLLFAWLHLDGQPALALPALGSALWDPATTPQLAGARTSNEHLLSAIRELAFVDGGRRPVDFRHLGAEELGSVYESLLELHPELDRASAHFELRTAAGHERKQTGSYYTPASLIGSLITTALDPVIDRAATQPDPEQALLELTVCDPACGSGHFLIAAANRIAKRLASIREQDPEPSPTATRHALRDVVSRCVYGVDSNPMAVELCKVSLWLEALEPGRPLSFLEDRVILGNSLLGATPALIAAGVPDEAYKPLLDDQKEVLKAWRAHNARERKGQRTMRLQAADPEQDAASLSAAAVRLRAIPDDSLDGVRRREEAFAQIVASEQRERLRLAADAWLAAFVTPKTVGSTRITTGIVRRVESDGRGGLTTEEATAIEVEAARYTPLHWHVAFPSIFRAGEPGAGVHGWVGGFDCVLGNPPWERVKLQEKEFFAARAPWIAAAQNKAARERLIAALGLEDPELFAAFAHAKRRTEGESRLLRSTGRYPLCGRGDVNTYAVFAEGMRTMLAPAGRLGVIVPTGIATDDTTKHFFADLVSKRVIASLYDFRTGAGLWADIGHQRFKFCLLTVAGSALPTGRGAEFAFFLLSIGELDDPQRRFELTAEDIRLLNPNTRTCPIFRTRRDAEITKGIYRRVPVLVREGDPDGNPWGIRFMRMFDMSTDSGLFHSRDELENAGWRLQGNIFTRGSERMLPLYEAKMIHHFDHQWATYERDGSVRAVTAAEKADPSFHVMPRYWVTEREVDLRLADWREPHLLGFRNIARTTDERTVIASEFPRVAVGHSMPLVFTADATQTKNLAALLSSFVLDYVARQKIGGVNLTFGYVMQFAAPLPDWIAESLHTTRAELDAAMFHLYGVPRDDVDYILGTFHIVRRKDEAKHGEYRTKRLILEAYDRLAVSAETVG